MPQYEIDFADGSVATVEAPEGASEQEILSAYYGGGEGSGLSELTRRRAIRETGPLGQFVRGLGAGAVGMTGTALQGAAELLPDEYEEPVQEGIAGLVDYLRPELLVGEDEGSTAQQIAAGFGQALGSTAPLIAAGAVGGLPAAAALGAAAGAGEAGQRARRAGASDEQQMFAVLQGTGVGLTEAGPLGAVARLFRPAAKAASIIAPKLEPGWRAKAKAAYDYTVRRAGPAAAEEAAQESIASSLQNLIERGYNPEQDIFDAGVFEEGAYGAGVGATIQALADIAIRGRNRRIISEAYVEDEARDARLARDLADAEEAGTAADVAMAEEAKAARDRDRTLNQYLLTPGQEGALKKAALAEEAAAFEDDTFVENLIDQAKPGEQFDFLAEDMSAVRPREDLGLDERAPAEVPIPERVVSGAQRDAQTVDMFEAARRREQEQEAPATGPMAQAMREAQRRQAFEQIEAEQAAQREAELDRLQNLARAEREVEAAPELRPAEPPMAQEPAPLEEPVQESLPGLGRPYQRGVTEEPAPEPRVVTREELRGIGLAGGSRLVKRIAGKPFESEEVQSEIANFVGNMNVSPEQRTAVRRWANETAAEQQDLFAEPISERARQRQEATARRRDRPVEPVVVPEEITPEPPPAVAPEPVPVEEVVAEPEAVAPEPPPAVAPEPVPVEEVAPEPEASAGEDAGPGEVKLSKVAPGWYEVRVGEGDLDRYVAYQPEGSREWFITYPGAANPDEVVPTLRMAREWIERHMIEAKSEPVEEVVAEPEAVTPEVTPKEGEPTADAGQPQQAKAAPEAQPEPEPAAEPEQEAPPASERPAEARPVEAAPGSESTPPLTTKDLQFLQNLGRSGPDQGGWSFRQAAYQYFRDYGARAFDAMSIDALLGDPDAEKGLLWLTKNLSKTAQRWVKQNLERIRADVVEADQASVSDVVQGAQKRSKKYMAERLKLQEAYAETDDAGEKVENDVDDVNAILTRSPKNALAVPLSPEVESIMLADGVTPALQAMAKQLRSPVMRSIARRIAAALQGSGVSVQILSPAEMDATYPKPGAPPGFYSEAQRTIYLNSASGLRNNVLLHEAVHAATVYFIKNRPNSAAVVALRKLFADVKPELGSAYGAENEVEFVSEMYSNPDFRSKMARLTPQGTKETVWQRFKNAVKRMLGFDAKSESLTTADSIIENIISGQLNVRDPGAIWKASSAGRGGQLVDDTYAFMPERTEQAVASLRANLQDPTIPEAAKEAVRFVQDLNTVKRTAGAKFPMYAELEDILRRQAAYAQKLLGYLQGTVREANKWVKSVQNETMDVLGKQVSKKAGLSYLLSTSTRTETDMSRPRSYYEKAVADAEANLPSATAGSYVSRLEAVEKAKERLAAYDVMAPWYQEIGPKGQETYKRSLNMFKRYKGELIDVLKEKLSRLPDSAVRNRLTKELVEKLENHGIDPYYPLVRNGRYWITYSANDPITGRNDTFITSFHTYKEREQAIRELEAQRDNIGLKGEVDKYDKLEASNFRNAPPESFIGNVQKILSDAGVDADVQASVLELYVDLLPERSFAKGLMHRGGKRGSVSDITPLTDITPQHDFIETLEQSGQRFTKQLATAKYVGEMADVENKATEFAKSDANKADPAVQGYYRDFQSRVGFARRPDISNVSRAITSGLYLFTMGFSPASAALQLSTLPLVTYPMLGGKYGYRESASQIARSTSMLKAAGNMREVERAGVGTVTETARETFRFIRSFGNYDLDAGKPEGMSDAEYANLKVFVDTLSKYNELGHTVNADLLDLQGTRSNMWGRVQQLGGFMNHSAELASRQVSGHAYYELELAKIPNPTDADRVRVAKEAIEFMSETNSSTLSGGVAPMSQNDWLRVLAMFKRWPVSMLQLQLEVMKGAFAGETPEAKRIARMQLAGMYGMAGLLAGATGAPLYGVLQMVFDALRDDDEEDFDTLVRTYMGEGFAKGIINYGLGVDVATRMAMTNFVFREPLIEQDSTLMNMLVMFGGPAIGVINNADRVASLWSQGEIERGFEALLPIAAKNILRSGRFAMEGARTLNGDPIVEDIHPLHIAAQVFGLAPAAYIRQLEQNAALLGIDRAINEKRTELLQKRNIAVRDGRSTRDIDREIAEFNRRQPQAAIDGDTIRRSQQAYRRTAERRREGAVFSELNDERMRIMAEAWGDATLFD